MSVFESSPIRPALSQMGVRVLELKLWNGLTILEWCREVPSSILELLSLLLQPKVALASRCSHDPAALTSLTVDKMSLNNQHRLSCLASAFLCLCLCREAGESLWTLVTG